MQSDRSEQSSPDLATCTLDSILTTWPVFSLLLEWNGLVVGESISKGTHRPVHSLCDYFVYYSG